MLNQTMKEQTKKAVQKHLSQKGIERSLDLIGKWFAEPKLVPNYEYMSI